MIQEYADMARAFNSPEPESGLMNMGLIILMNAQIFADSIKEWNLLDARQLDKSWKTFKKHFIDAQREYKKARNTVTTADLGLSSPAPTANLAYCSPADPDPSAALPDAQAYLQALQASHFANQVLPVQDPAPTPQANVASAASDPILQQLLDTIKTLSTEVAAVKSSVGNKKGKKKDGKGNLYCWTHGLCRHKSSDCKHKATGHKDDATFADRKGGSVKNCFFLESGGTSA